MRLVVVGEEDVAVLAQAGQFVANGFPEVELFSEPTRHHARKGRQPMRRNRQIGFQKARKLCDWLVVEDYGIKFGLRDAAELQAKIHRMRREAFVIFPSAETFFLSGGDDLPIAQKRRSRVMIVGRDAKNMAHEHWRAANIT